ncbi:hypothetical protein FF38_10486 [Lucilia cuprina]|uniref:Uncharacterized protein n=1 Tax=Lucilia cuprina TaxID=7375 RepID=A0A0L0C562_LUCCU|nr:uncharacterized protein KIAA2013 homolog [Lucilia cuprina]KAI8124808.1 hypothetical protein CVS40_4781 [Lucilia cuprina]KNC27372.1 hypothetical protein FF38_10486 [Lucilia cuprina]
MFRTAKYKFDVTEVTRKLFVSYRRLFAVMLGVCIFFYILPPIFRYLFMNAPEKKDPLMQCMDDRLTPFFLQNFEFDANIRHVPPLAEERNIIPYVGNGYIGLEIAHDAPLNIKYGRAMQLPTQFHPVVSVKETDEAGREATVVEYLTGIAWRFQCFSNMFVSYSYYAHRTHPSVLMQEIKITNTRNTMEEVNIILPRVHFQNPSTRNIQLGSTETAKQFDVITGTIHPNPDDASVVIVVTIVKPQMSRNIQLKKRGSIKMEIPIAVHYSKPLKKEQQQQVSNTIEETEQKAIMAMTKVLQSLQSKSESASTAVHNYRQSHINVWSDLWATGFTISTSKAENSLNGDRINATMYAVLSQTRSYEFEEFVSVSAPSKQDIAKALTYAEGCYDSYHTLQADNLWLPMDSLEKLNKLVSTWMLTLEKQGCHNLIRAGSSGVIQAMVLSFGSFRFSNQHLECNMHPKYLHRDFHFRRLNYGNRTHVNVTINVTEDNKAVINVALDRSDRSYYACDGGCVDEPVLLTQNRRQFPVKLTEPLTAILYITEDKQHMVELHDALHVKEVAEAPAHEQHVIALHKHGHQLGGLPTLFWVSVCAIIIVFHIFLCKLIIKEYCEPSDKIRYRYNKP